MCRIASAILSTICSFQRRFLTRRRNILPPHSAKCYVLSVIERRLFVVILASMNCVQCVHQIADALYVARLFALLRACNFVIILCACLKKESPLCLRVLSSFIYASEDLSTIQMILFPPFRLLFVFFRGNKICPR